MAVINSSIFVAIGVLIRASCVLGFVEQQNVPKLTDGLTYSLGTGRAGQTNGLESGQVYGPGAGQANGVGSGHKYEPRSGRGYEVSKTDGAQTFYYIPEEGKNYYGPESGHNNGPGSGLAYWSESGQSRLPGNGRPGQTYGPGLGLPRAPGGFQGTGLGSGQTYGPGSGHPLVQGNGQTYGIVSGHPRVRDARERYGLGPGQTYGPGSHDVPGIFDPPPPVRPPWYKSFIDQVPFIG